MSLTHEELQESIIGLPDFVLTKISKVIAEYKAMAAGSEALHFDVCPKCGKDHPHVIKGGKSGSWKQMFRCKHCNARFSINFGDVSFHSHFGPDVWDEQIKLELEGNHSLVEIAELLNMSESTAFRNRHKIMRALEKDEDCIKLSQSAELDEKYLLKSHKGKRLKGKRGRKRGGNSSKRGLSDDQVCIMTGIQRNGESFLRAYNMGIPRQEEALKLRNHIAKNTFIFKDGTNAYNTLLKEIESKHITLLSKDDYDSVNHLNNVNSFHSRISCWYERMRGVATQYINRYSALFNIRWITRALDITEAVIFVKARLRKRMNFISLNDLKNCNLFSPSDLSWEAA